MGMWLDCISLLMSMDDITKTEGLCILLINSYTVRGFRNII